MNTLAGPTRPVVRTYGLQPKSENRNVDATAAKQARKLREAQTRRKAIIKVVRKLIRKGGLADVSLRRVAELAGFSTTVVYSLFADKATLIAQAMDEDLLELTRVMAAAAAQAGTPLERIRAAGRAYIRFGLEHPAEYSFVFMQQRPHAPNESSSLRHGDPSQDPYAFGRQAWSELAQAGLVAGGDAETDQMTQIFWEAIHGLTSRHLVMGPDDRWFPVLPAEGHVEAMLDVLLAGIVQRFGAPPAGGARRAR
jgi:AcrR family transcriptional regulator